MKYLALLAFLLSSNLLASGGAGNGGDAIVCPDKVILLDSYEAQKMRLRVNLINPKIEKQTWRSMVNVAVKRLQRVDENTASLLYDYSMEMVNDFEKFEMYPDDRGKVVYLGYDVITEVNDSYHSSMPEGCEKFPRQLVIQKEPQFSRQFRYEFSKSLWEKMDIQEQSLTILHEAWYRIMIENGAKNSISARYMNGLVASKDFEALTFAEYIEEIKNTEIHKYTVNNYSESIKDRKIVIDLKTDELTLEDGFLCAIRKKFNPSIRETFSVINQSPDYFKEVTPKKICVKNSRIRKIGLRNNIVDYKNTLRLPFNLIIFESSKENPTLHYDSRGKLTQITDIIAGKISQMYYNCNGVRSMNQNSGCQSGPFIYKPTVIKNTDELIFDEKERLINFKY